MHALYIYLCYMSMLLFFACCNSAGNTACMYVGISVNACEHCALTWFYCFEECLSEVIQLKKQLEEEKELLLAKVHVC